MFARRGFAIRRRVARTGSRSTGGRTRPCRSICGIRRRGRPRAAARCDIAISVACSGIVRRSIDGILVSTIGIGTRPRGSNGSGGRLARRWSHGLGLRLGFRLDRRRRRGLVLGNIDQAILKLVLVTVLPALVILRLARVLTGNVIDHAAGKRRHKFTVGHIVCKICPAEKVLAAIGAAHVGDAPHHTLDAIGAARDINTKRALEPGLGHRVIGVVCI